MDTSRRWFLATGLGGAASLAGCIGNPFGGEETTTTTTNSQQTTKPKQTQTTTAEQTTEEPTTTTVERPALAQETDSIFNEIAWFTTEYEAAVDGYQDVCKSSIDEIEQFRGVGTLSTDQIETITAASMEAATYFDEHLESHFNVYGPVPEGHLAEIEKFSNRGDADRAQEELEALIDHLVKVSTDVFVQRELSHNPIQDTLWAALSTVDGGVIFGFQNHTSGYTNWVYPTKPDDFNKIAYAAVNGDQRDLFGPTLNPTSRTELLSLTVNLVPKNVRWEKQYFTNVPIIIQRYSSASAASAAFDAIVESTVTLESERELGRATWHEGYYDYDGDIHYAYFLQVGNYVFAMDPSRTPWDERDDTTPGILERTWLWKA